MPIRIQEAPQELPTIRSGRVQNAYDPGTAAIPGQQIEQRGKALQGAAGAMAEIVQREQEKANKVRLNDAYNQAVTAAYALRYDKDQGYLRHKGADAVKGVAGDDGVARPIAQTYGDKLNKTVAGIRASLGNTAIAEQFDLLAGDLGTKFHNEAVGYEAEQANVYAGQVSDQTIVSRGNLLAADPFGVSSTQYVADIANAARLKAKQAGLDPEGTAVLEKETLGKVHSAVIASLLEGKNTTGAKAYFDMHKGDLPGLDAANLKAKLDTATAGAEAISAVDEVVAAYPLINNQVAAASDMRAALRAKYKDEPEKLKAASAELDQRLQDFTFQEKETNAGNVDAVWKLRNAGQSLASVEGSSAWLALPGAIQGQLRDQWKNQDDDPAKLSSETWQSWLQLMLDDKALAAMTPTQIAALEPQFGRQLTAQIANNASSIKTTLSNKSAAAQLASPKIDTDLFLTIAKDFGLKAYTQNISSDDAQKLAVLRFTLEDKVAKHQLATGKIIPPGEMPAFVRGLAAHEMVKAMRQATTISPGAGALIPLPGAGTLDSARIAAYLKEKNLPPTVENQRKAYLDVLEAGQYLVDE